MRETHRGRIAGLNFPEFFLVCLIVAILLLALTAALGPLFTWGNGQ